MSEKDEQVDVDATSTTDEQDIEINLDDTDDVETLKTQIAEKDTFARQAVARAKKAEAELKSLKEKPAGANLNQSALSKEETELLILQSKGIDKELLGEMKTLAKVRGKSILEIEDDPIFIAMKDEREARVKAEKSKLGASRGSGTQKATKTFNTPGLSEEEHREMIRNSSL